MALLLRRCRTLASPRLSRLSSSSSFSDGGGENDENPPPPPPSYSSYLSDVKANLRPSPPSPPRKPPFSRSPVHPSLLSPRFSKMPSLDEINKNLSEYRRRSAAPSQSTAQGSSSPPPVSFQDIYNSKPIGKPAEDPAAAIVTKKTTFYSIRESLRRQRNRSSNPPPPMNRSTGSETLEPLFSESLQKFQNLKLPPEGSFIFGREMGEKREAESQALKTEFVKEKETES